MSASHSLTSHTKLAAGMIREMYGYALQAVGHRAAQNFQGQVLKFTEKVGMRICPESTGEKLSNVLWLGGGLRPRKMNTETFMLHKNPKQTKQKQNNNNKKKPQ